MENETVIISSDFQFDQTKYSDLVCLLILWVLWDNLHNLEPVWLILVQWQLKKKQIGQWMQIGFPLFNFQRKPNDLICVTNVSKDVKWRAYRHASQLDECTKYHCGQSITASSVQLMFATVRLLKKSHVTPFIAQKPFFL